MKLSFSWNGESRQWLRFVIQLHLPEAGGKVQGGENGRVGSADVADALGDLLHGVFVDVGVLVEFPEILYDPESLALFLGNAENGRVVE